MTKLICFALPAVLAAVFFAQAAAQATNEECTIVGGVCQDPANSPCDGRYVAACSQPTTHQCCVPTEAIKERQVRGDEECYDRGGYCQRVASSCSGAYKYSWCSGIFNSCCVPWSRL